MNMILTKSLYDQIVSAYEKHEAPNCLKFLCAEFPDVPEMTLEAITYQIFQRRMEKEYQNYSVKATSYYKRYLNAESEQEHGFLFKMAIQEKLSPSLMARMILKKHYLIQAQKQSPNASKQQKKELDTKVCSHLKDISLIKDGRLATEIQVCLMKDVNYGPIADKIKRGMGDDYELYLQELLKERGIEFYVESELRDRGYDKTPDIRLKIPIGVNGIAINWIESKASFGDMERHKEYLKSQYSSYYNRFGAGLVIYWFGYLEEVRLNQYYKNILVYDKIPDITYMNPGATLQKKLFSTISTQTENIS